MDKPSRKRHHSDLPICKYGSCCYRKNPEHRKKFHHPEPDTEATACTRKEKDLEIDDHLNSSSLTEEESSSQDVSDFEILSPNEHSEDNLPDENPQKLKFLETVQMVLKSMPKDFFDFWEFVCSVNAKKPEDALSGFGLHLVGLYDLLSMKLPKEKKVSLHCHWRYFYDPPEFQTVVKMDGKDQYHIGYFRDEPSGCPTILASNSAAIGPRLTLLGDNIFAAVNSIMGEQTKKLASKLPTKVLKIQSNLQEFAKKNGYSLDCQTAKTKARNKKVVAKTFHGLGIVVPVKNDVGYRPLPDSNAKIKTVLKRIIDAENEDQRLEREEAFDELMSNVHFANDEGDWGMGLEFGIDLFCYGHEYFHARILHILPLAYNLLNRPKYAEIVTSHLANRKKSDNLSTLT